MAQRDDSWRDPPPLRTLIIDDDPLTREILRVILEREGHQVDECQNGAQAIALCLEQGRTFDLVLVDIVMPGMSGLEVVAALRAAPAHRRTAIVCVTARADDRSRREALAAGCDGFVRKPFRRNELLRAIASVLNSRGPAGPSPRAA